MNLHNPIFVLHFKASTPCQAVFRSTAILDNDKRPWVSQVFPHLFSMEIGQIHWVFLVCVQMYYVHPLHSHLCIVYVHSTLQLTESSGIYNIFTRTEAGASCASPLILHKGKGAPNIPNFPKTAYRMVYNSLFTQGLMGTTRLWMHQCSIVWLSWPLVIIGTRDEAMGVTIAIAATLWPTQVQ